MGNVRGIRGAITVSRNSKEEIVASTMSLIAKMISVNNVKVEDVASVIFTVTRDINAEFPAIAARKMGWLYTPLLCAYEIDVAGSLEKCIRILMHVNSDKKQAAIKHIYLGKAKTLRPDIGSGRKNKYYLS